MEKSYRIIRIINNNVITAIDGDKRRCLLIGRGIGFKAKPHDIVKDSERIEKVFYLVDSNADIYGKMMDKSSREVVGAVEEAISEIDSYLDEPLGENIHITLLDHINFALVRLKNNVNIQNPMLNEIKYLYSEEFILADKAVKFLNERLQINLPEDEAGFIALHINASLHDKNVRELSRSNELISDAISFIENEVGQQIERSSIEYFRFLTHFQFAIDRAVKGEVVENLLLDTIKDKFFDSFSVAEKMAEFISDKYDVQFDEDERGRIALHIENMLKKRRRISDSSIT